jgi:hypothetical protein
MVLEVIVNEIEKTMKFFAGSEECTKEKMGGKGRL